MQPDGSIRVHKLDDDESITAPTRLPVAAELPRDWGLQPNLGE